MNDQIVFESDTYTITKKGGDKTGTIDAPYALIDIGIAGLEDPTMPQIFSTKEEHTMVLDLLIQRLLQVKQSYQPPIEPPEPPKPAILLK